MKISYFNKADKSDPLNQKRVLRFAFANRLLEFVIYKGDVPPLVTTFSVQWTRLLTDSENTAYCAQMRESGKWPVPSSVNKDIASMDDLAAALAGIGSKK